MINFYNQVPSIYNSASRDFQYLSWLINIVLNHVKHNIDDIYNLPNTKADPRLAELLAMTLGFKVKRNYDQKQLAALVSVLPGILKYKGTTEAVTLAVKALIKASGATGRFECKLVTNGVEVLLPKALVDTTLLMDLFPYILPAGITCRIIRKTQDQTDVPPIEVAYDDVLYANWQIVYDDRTYADKDQLAGLFNVDSKKEPNFANYNGTSYNGTELDLNTGLLANNLIPILDSSTKFESDYYEETNDSGTTVIINKYSTEDNDQGTTIQIGGKS